MNLLMQFTTIKSSSQSIRPWLPPSKMKVIKTDSVGKWQLLYDSDIPESHCFQICQANQIKPE